MTGPDRPSAPIARLVFVVTDSITAGTLLRGQLGYLARHGFDVELICSPGSHLAEVRDRERVTCHELAIAREISPLRDIRSLFALVRLLRRLRPDILAASTPKAGVLGMLAGFLARVPCRVRTIRGLRLETTTGWKRLVLSAAERASSACAHRVVCVSESLRTELLRRGLASPSRTIVLGAGSSNGVDLARFRPLRDARDAEESSALRRSLGLTPDTAVVGFVGRLVQDKGVEDLVRAFRDIVLVGHPDARLLILGEPETGDPASAEALAYLAREAAVVAPGHVAETAPYYRLMQVLAFPSYREGLPNAPLEAAASGVPTVGYAATGTVNAVVSGSTGELVPSGDWQGLGDALVSYLADPAIRQRHGSAALERARRLYDQNSVWDRWREFYASPMGHPRGAQGAQS